MPYSVTFVAGIRYRLVKFVLGRLFVYLANGNVLYLNERALENLKAVIGSKSNVNQD